MIQIFERQVTVRPLERPVRLEVKLMPAAKVVVKAPLPPSGVAESIDVFTIHDALYVGDLARFRPLSDGIIFELKDTDGNWKEVWRQVRA